jgi:hypothetical protein
VDGILRSQSRRRAVACVAFAGGLLFVACAPLKPPPPSPSTVSVPFGFTGSPQSFVVPNGVTQLTIFTFGAAGGTGRGQVKNGTTVVSENTGGSGAAGGAAVATLAATPGESLQVNVGGRGADADLSSPTANGGFNGGGTSTRGVLGCLTLTDTALGGGGGGASDVRQSGTALANRVVVAGGGGGGGSPNTYGDSTLTQTTDGGGGGPGGGLDGGTGGGAEPGGGATQTTGGGPGSTGGSPGVAGTGGNGSGQGQGSLTSCQMISAGGGGGGLFGGGGGGVVATQSSNDPGGGGGGGGSGFGPNGTQFWTGAHENDGQVVIVYKTP